MTAEQRKEEAAELTNGNYYEPSNIHLISLNGPLVVREVFQKEGKGCQQRGSLLSVERDNW